MKKFIAFIFALTLCAVASPSFAASGCTYPGTLDSYVDKIAGDFLTLADVNSRSCAIEKLETGPLRPNDGTAAAPAYAFRSAASSGMYYTSGSPLIGFSIGGVTVGTITRAASSVNFINLLATATGTGPQIVSAGTDTNVPLVLNTKGTGVINLAVGGTIMQAIDSSGRISFGTTQLAGTGANDVIIKNLASVRAVNAAGTSTLQTVTLDASDRLLLGGTGVTDIIWSKALVTLGAGSTATLGLAGTPGPTTSTQNSWMRVVDSSNNAFFVPAWK
jgi:hypothetical protein